MEDDGAGRRRMKDGDGGRRRLVVVVVVVVAVAVDVVYGELRVMPCDRERTELWGEKGHFSFVLSEECSLSTNTNIHVRAVRLGRPDRIRPELMQYCVDVPQPGEQQVENGLFLLNFCLKHAQSR
eukprot:3917491-Rhodomonas_salina.1